MEARTTQKYIHTSPRKLRLVAQRLRKMEPGKALELLKFTNKAAAVEMAKAIKTSLANARVKGAGNMLFQTIEINEGPKMKRFRAGAKGRVRPFERRWSHIKIVLAGQEKEASGGAKD